MKDNVKIVTYRLLKQYLNNDPIKQVLLNLIHCKQTKITKTH